MTTVSNWDATSFFERLTDTNILARNKKFRFCKVSGLQGFEDALATLQTTTAFVCVSDTAEGYTELNNSPRTRRVKTVFFAMRHQLGNMAARLIYVGTDLGIYQASGTLPVSRSAHPLLGDTRVFRFRLRLRFVPSGCGYLHRFTVQ